MTLAGAPVPAVVTPRDTVVAVDARTDDPRSDLEVEPAWYATILVTVLAGVVATGAVGLALAVVGAFHAVTTLLLGGGLAVAVVVLARPWRRHRTDRGRPATRPALAALAIVLVVTAHAAARPSEHAFVDRDPGSYTTTARWLAAEGTLRVEGLGAPFVADGGLAFDSAAVYREGDDRLALQFNHLVPVLLALGHAIGGDDLMFRVPALLHGLALLGLFALALRVLGRGWPALLVVATLAVTLPQLALARDAYSEGATQVLLFGALWLLATDGRLASAGRCLLAGLLLGGAVAARVDSALYLLVVPAVGAWSVVTARRRDDAPPWRALAALAGGAALTAALGIVDVATRSGRYATDLRAEMTLLWVGVTGATAVAFAVPVVVARAAVWRARWSRWQRRASIAAAGLTSGAFAYLWLVRPRLETTHASAPNSRVEHLQATAGLPVEPTRRYAEHSLEWISWYLGPVTVALGIVGAALVVTRLVRGRSQRALAFMVAFTAPAVLYLWRPSITPDHLWVMRRYLPIVVPGLVLLAVLVVTEIARRYPGPRARVAFACATVLVLVPPAVATWPLRDLRHQAGYAEVVRDACAIIGPQGAALVLAGENLQHSAPQTLRAWCGVPVAATPPAFPPERIVALADAWRAEGRELWLVAASPPSLAEHSDTDQIVDTALAVNLREPESTLTRRPDRYEPTSFQLHLARVDPGRGEADALDGSGAARFTPSP